MLNFFETWQQQEVALLQLFLCYQMHLTNIFSLTGLMFLLQILHTMEMSFGMAKFLLLLEKKQKKTLLVGKVRLAR